jgi:hypothetical protein
MPAWAGYVKRKARMLSLTRPGTRARRCGLWLSLAVVVPLVAATLVLGNPLAGRASAITIPMVFPLESRVTVTRSFMAPRDGHLHQGIDLLAPKMTREMAAVSGTVTLQVRTYNGQPWYTLWLAGDDGHGYYYSHINNDTPGTNDGKGLLEYAFAPGVVTGTRVSQGQFIAYCGDSGNASSPHLHFQVHETTSMFSPAVDPYDSLYRAPLANGAAPPLWPVPRLTSYEQTNSKIAYTGQWSTLSATGASGGSYTHADSKAGALIWFEGTRLELLATKAASQGKALVSVDGGAPQSVDLYSATTLFKKTVWSTGVLDEGTHTVSLTWTGDESATGGGIGVNIDAIDVTGKLIQAPMLTTSQQSSSFLAYRGIWRVSSTPSASGGSFTYADSWGASVTAQFTGIYIAWMAKKSGLYGKAELTLDGGEPVTVDLYSAMSSYRQKVWNSGLLPYGVHTLKIRWTGVKNLAAGGTTVNLDGLQVMGAFHPVGAAVWEGPTAGTTIEPPAH